MNQCMICENDETKASFYPKLAFNNKIFEYRKCTRCKLIYLVPSLTEEDTEKLYDSSYHDEFYFKSETAKSKQYQAALILKYKSSGRFLDYGCGDASFLNFLSGSPYELSGAEYNPELVEKLNSSYPGIKFYSIPSLAETGYQKFDVIHLCDVLGQVADPRQLLLTLRRYLAPGGMLFIESPVEHNFHILYLFRAGYFRFRKLLNPKRVVNGKPYRVMFSNRKNQELFFKNCGYKKVHYEIFEWAWPLPDHWKDAKTAFQKLGYVAGSISKFFSRRIKGWGNRFYYIGTANEE